MNRIFTAVLFLIASTQFIFVFGLNFDWLPGSTKIKTSDVQDANTDCAINVLQEVAQSDKLTLISSLSFFDLFSIAYFIAHGGTKWQIGQIITGHARTTKSKVEKCFTDFLEVATRTKSDNYTMKVANRIYLHDELLKKDFVLPMSFVYNGEIVHKCEPFQRNVILQDIAKWISHTTENRIDGVNMRIGKGVEMLMLNTVTFKDKWQKQFDTQPTAELFYHSETEKKSMLMMKTYGTFSTYTDAYVRVLMLPYASTEVQMVLILPKKRFKLASVLRGLTREKLMEYMRNAEPTKLKVVLPKFQLQKRHRLKEFFKRTGVTKAFSERAKFLMRTKRIYITDILQGGSIQVNEAGTEVSKISAFVFRSDRFDNSEAARLNGSSCQTSDHADFSQHDQMFIGDQPFLFFIIKDQQTVLFTGQYS